MITTIMGSMNLVISGSKLEIVYVVQKGIFFISLHFLNIWGKYNFCFFVIIQKGIIIEYTFLMSTTLSFSKHNVIFKMFEYFKLLQIYEYFLVFFPVKI